jgi:hypothetical protein
MKQLQLYTFGLLPTVNSIANERADGSANHCSWKIHHCVINNPIPLRHPRVILCHNNRGE